MTSTMESAGEALAARDGLPEHEILADAVAARVCQEACELPDRTSPEDWPEALLITSDELHRIVKGAVSDYGQKSIIRSIRALSPAPAQPAPSAASEVPAEMIEAACEAYHGSSTWRAIVKAGKMIGWVASYRGLMREIIKAALAATRGGQEPGDVSEAFLKVCEALGIQAAASAHLDAAAIKARADGLTPPPDPSAREALADIREAIALVVWVVDPHDHESGHGYRIADALIAAGLSPAPGLPASGEPEEA